MTLFILAGELHVPLDVCGAVVKRELDFWGVDEYLIKPCCWTCYSSYIDNQRALADFNRSVKKEMEELSSIQHLSGWKKKQMKIWMLLDHPRSSRVALVSRREASEAKEGRTSGLSEELLCFLYVLCFMFSSLLHSSAILRKCLPESRRTCFQYFPSA